MDNQKQNKLILRGTDSPCLSCPQLHFLSSSRRTCGWILQRLCLFYFPASAVPMFVYPVLWQWCRGYVFQFQHGISYFHSHVNRRSKICCVMVFNYAHHGIYYRIFCLLVINFIYLKHHWVVQWHARNWTKFQFKKKGIGPNSIPLCWEGHNCLFQWTWH